LKNLQEHKEIIEELDMAQQAMERATEKARKIGYPNKELEIIANKISYIILSHVQFVREVKEVKE
jgi:hypothetical protein